MAATAASQDVPRCISLLQHTAMNGVGGAAVHSILPPRDCRWAATGVDIVALESSQAPIGWLTPQAVIQGLATQSRV